MLMAFYLRSGLFIYLQRLHTCLCSSGSRGRWIPTQAAVLCFENYSCGIRNIISQTGLYFSFTEIKCHFANKGNFP